MGYRKPSRRKIIPPEWSDKVTNGEYWEQVKIYAEMLVDMATMVRPNFPELVNQLSNLPIQAVWPCPSSPYQPAFRHKF